MADDFLDQIDQFQKELNEAFNLSVDDKEKITNAGAEVFYNQLKDKTPESDRAHTGKTLKEDLGKSKGNIDGVEDGTTSVGWYAGKNGKAYIANFMDKGTKFYPRHAENDHRGFYTNTLNSSFNVVIEAQHREYMRILKQKGLDK